MHREVTVLKSRQTDVPATVRTESGTESRFSLPDDALPGRHSNVGDASLAGNPNIRVPETVKIEDGLRVRRVEEEERDADRAGGTTRGGPEETEGTPSTREALNPSAQDQIATKEEAEERELRHVPGGTWLNQVRSYIKDSFWLKGRGTAREERGGRLQEEGRGFVGRGEEERDARKGEEGH
ncbi:hypothetical protein NDU88_006014 [Pleurodeles waltl]|uniref:Uncharacterized protein n=1 Tax=Pleurodeles waltl TaxID=8319 RepID=A0AAV7MEL1_PLEWA|nr:hypothetical protein NDU88_006014 [Pleurodeles waltl]